QRKRPAVRGVPAWLNGLELVAQADHVDQRVDVDVNFYRGGVQLHGGLGADVDVANLRVDHQLVVQHVVGADLEGQAERAVEAEAVEVSSLACPGQLFIEEDGVVEAGADIGLEGRVATQRVIHCAQGRRQVGQI